MGDPLDDIRIADFSQMLQGPFATQKLADLGADVIKIEPPWGDPARTGSWNYKGTAAKFLSKNRNKRSIAIDLKSDEGYDVTLEILKESDVLIENFRPGAMERLDLDYDTVSTVNPGIIYASASGYGESGPYEDEPGHGLLAQSISGLPTVMGRKNDPPMLSAVPIGDESSAMNLALYIVTALYERDSTGEGQKIEVNLLDSMIEVLNREIVTLFNTEWDGERSEEGIAYPTHGAPYGVYETRDGYITITGVPTMEIIGEAIGIDPDLYDTPEKHYENRDLLKRKIESYTRTREKDELLEELRAEGCWVSEVKSLDEVIEDPQVEHNGSIVEMEDDEGDTFINTGVPVHLPGRSLPEYRMPPELGEHTEDILVDIGYDREDATTLAESGVIGRSED